MPIKPAVRFATTTTLTFAPAEGTPTSGTVVVYDQHGNVLVASTAASVSGSSLTYSLASTLIDDDPGSLGLNYWADWTAVVSGTTYGPRSQPFDVVRHPIYQTLTSARFTARFPRLASRVPAASTFASFLDFGWEAMLQHVVGAGREPNLIRDPGQFEIAHGYWTAAKIAENLAAGSRETEPWLQTADDCERQAKEWTDNALAHARWYDANQSGKPDSEETNAHLGRVRLSR